VKQKFPLSYKLLAEMQAKDKNLQKQLLSQDQTTYVYKTFRHSNKEYKLVTRDDKIVIPKSLERKATSTKWYHEHLLHPRETRLELMLKQHFTFIGLKPMCVKACKACNVCPMLKANDKKYDKVPPKAEPELIPWHSHALHRPNRSLSLWGQGKGAQEVHPTSLHDHDDPATGSWF
jgi:hypothetical protein